MSNWHPFNVENDSHIYLQDWPFQLPLLHFDYLVLQFSNNLDGTWHIAHLHNWPQIVTLSPVSPGAESDISGQPGPQI